MKTKIILLLALNCYVYSFAQNFECDTESNSNSLINGIEDCTTIPNYSQYLDLFEISYINVNFHFVSTPFGSFYPGADGTGTNGCCGIISNAECCNKFNGQYNAKRIIDYANKILESNRILSIYTYTY